MSEADGGQHLRQAGSHRTVLLYKSRCCIRRTEQSNLIDIDVSSRIENLSCVSLERKKLQNCFALKKIFIGQRVWDPMSAEPLIGGSAGGRGVITPLIEAMITNFVHVNITRHPGSGCGIRNGYIKCGWARFSLDISSSKCHAER